MNTIIENMITRRSIRKFKPDMLPKETIDEIITAGTYAANGMGRQSAIIVAVTNKELRDKLSEMNCKIGGWIHRAKEEFESAEGKDILRSLGINGEYEGIGHCVIGYPAEPLPEAAPRKENHVFYAE